MPPESPANPGTRRELTEAPVYRLPAIHCISCGRFTNCDDPDARHRFEPDNHFGPERVEWTCGPCSRRQPPPGGTDRGGEG